MVFLHYRVDFPKWFSAQKNKVFFFFLNFVLFFLILFLFFNIFTSSKERALLGFFVLFSCLCMEMNAQLLWNLKRYFVDKIITRLCLNLWKRNYGGFLNRNRRHFFRLELKSPKLLNTVIFIVVNIYTKHWN